MNKNTITIARGDNAEQRVAEIVAQLVREGVTFEVVDYFNGYQIKLTGGF